MNKVNNVADISLIKAKRYLPEPEIISTKDILNGAMRATGSLVNTFAPAIGSRLNSVGLDPSYSSLIEQQVAIQVQMQTTSMQSNIERSKHEALMTPIRNTRVS